MNDIFIVTHDNVEIKHGELFFSLNPRPLRSRFIKGLVIPANTIVGPYINPKADTPSGDLIFFSTREAAEQYSNENPYETSN